MMQLLACWRGLLSAMASLRTTLAGMVVLLLGVTGAYFKLWPGSWAVALPLLLLALNLLCAIMLRPKFHRDLPLLLFHLSLLALAATGFVEAAEGRDAHTPIAILADADFTVVTDTLEDLLYGMVLEAESDTGDDGPTIQTGDTITFVRAVAVIGDWVEVTSDGTNWYVHGMTAADGGVTLTQED